MRDRSIVGQNNPNGIEFQEGKDNVPFTPDRQGHRRDSVRPDLICLVCSSLPRHRFWRIPAGSHERDGAEKIRRLHGERTAAFHGLGLETRHSAYGHIASASRPSSRFVLFDTALPDVRSGSGLRLLETRRATRTP
jgi:hypothetical protein